MNYVCFLVARAVLAQTPTDMAIDDRAELELVVVEDGVPVPGATVLVDGQEIGTTDDQGAVIGLIPSGRTQLEVRRNTDVVLSLDLLTDERELVLIIATLRPGEPPELLIENSGRQSVLADEREDDRPAVGGDVELERNAEAKEPGALIGTIVSADDQEPVVRARVFFSGITIEVVTDKDGRFEAELPAGTYSVSVVHPRFSSQTLESIRVIPSREVTLNIELNPAGIRLQDYVVTAPYVEGSVASVIEQQREAAGVSDVLGAAQIEATGDSNAAEALTRVTGLTVEDGKFVLVRGQPSRFTLALFNGSPLPSPEPLIQVVPLDLFPTGVLQGIEVQKSYSPDMPGAFGAGLVRLNTRGVPEEDFLKLSVSTGYNTISTFEDGLTYQGGSYDWLGFDDGTRALPDSVDATTAGGTISLDDRTQITEDQKNEAGQTFPGIYNTRSTTLPPDLGLGVTAGGSFSLPANGSFGIIGTVGYGNQWRFQERIQRSFALSNEELRVRDDTIENRTDNDVELSGLLTAAASWDNHEISLNTFVVNQTQQRTQFTTGREIGSSQLDIERSLLSWIERFLAAQQITGRHDFEWLLLEYRGLYAVAQRDAPDRREYTYSRAPAQDQFFIRDPSGAFRSYSFVDDTRLSFGLDLSTDVLASEESWLRIVPKVGLAVNNTDRDAGEQRFVWRPSDDADRSIRDPEEIFDPALTGTLLDLRDNSILGADDYTGSSDIFGLYAMADIEFGDLFRLVGGVRRETADYLVETFQLADAESVAASAGFDETDYLPSASLTWFALDELQIRAAYGRTVSRPVFNELSTSSFFDPDTGQQFQGNPNLVPTVIDGYDIRVEWYPSTTESFSVGAFLKDYTDPLERTFVALGGGGFIATFQNADSAEVLGIEFGGRAELQRIREWLGGPSFLEDIYVSANAAILDSEVELTEQGIATDTARPLDGQADIVVNVQAGFDTEEHDLTIAYNLVGTRLRRAGVLAQPNIFQDPIDTLDLNYTWQITDEAALKASASNLLNPSTRLTQQVEGDEEQVFREFKRGRGFGLGFSYSFK